MYTGLLHSHSTLAYVVLLFLAFVVIKSILGLSRGSTFSPGDERLSKLTLIFVHIQVLLGLGLYFVSPLVQGALSDMAATMKDSALRQMAVEHISINIIAAVLITIGRVKARKATEAKAKYKKLLVFYGLGLLLILSRIPWSAWLD